MNKAIFSLLALSLVACTNAGAQDSKKEKKNEEKKEIIVEEKSSGKNEKMVIVVDGDKVTINGKPADEYKGKKRIVIDNDVLIDDNEIHFPRNGAMTLRGFGNRAMLGVSTEKADNGVRVKEVVKESAAEKAGLKAGDIITRVGDKDIKEHRDLVAVIDDKKPEETVDVTLLRDGKEKKVKATLGKSNVPNNMSWNFDNKRGRYEFNMEPPMAMVNPRIQMSPRMFSDNDMWLFRDDRPKFGMSIEDNDEGDGVKVTGLEADSYAAKSGVKEKDIITEADGHAVKNVDELKDILGDAMDKASVNIKVLRNGATESLTLKVPKVIKKADL